MQAPCPDGRPAVPDLRREEGREEVVKVKRTPVYCCDKCGALATSRTCSDCEKK